MKFLPFKNQINMDIANIDFGAYHNESLQTYILRLEKQVKLWKDSHNGKMSPNLQHIILGIFEDLVTNPNNQKMQQMHEMLKNQLRREPTMEDFWNIKRILATKLAE